MEEPETLIRHYIVNKGFESPAMLRLIAALSDNPDAYTKFLTGGQLPPPESMDFNKIVDLRDVMKEFAAFILEQTAKEKPRYIVTSGPPAIFRIHDNDRGDNLPGIYQTREDAQEVVKLLLGTTPT